MKRCGERERLERLEDAAHFGRIRRAGKRTSVSLLRHKLLLLPQVFPVSQVRHREQVTRCLKTVAKIKFFVIRSGSWIVDTGSPVSSITRLEYTGRID